MEPSSPIIKQTILDGYTLKRSNTPKERNSKRNSDGSIESSSLMIAQERLQYLLADSMDESSQKSIRKNSSPENLITQRVAKSVLSFAPEEEIIESFPTANEIEVAGEEPTKIAETPQGKSYDQELIKRSIEEQSTSELETPITPPKITRKASQRLLKRSLSRKEADQQRQDINEQCRQIFHAHGHYHPEDPQERLKNLEKWVNKYTNLRQIYIDSGMQKEIDVKVAGLARISLTKAYFDKINPSVESIEAMMLEFYTQTNYQHHDTNHAVKHLIEAYERFPEDLKPYLEKTIILNAPPSHLALYLFERLEAREEDETGAIIKFFTSHLATRKRTEDVVKFFGILFETDIWRQQQELDATEFLQVLFRRDNHLSIKMLQAYERKKFPSVIDNLIADFKHMYVTLVHPHKGRRHIYRWIKHIDEKEEENILTAFKQTIANFCINPMEDELAQILRLFREKLDKVIGETHPGMALDLVSSIFVLRLVGYAATLQYSFPEKQKDGPVVYLPDTKILVTFSKWLNKCLEFVFDVDKSKSTESPEDKAEKEKAKGKFTISKETFSHFMDLQTKM